MTFSYRSLGEQLGGLWPPTKSKAKVALDRVGICQRVGSLTILEDQRTHWIEVSPRSQLGDSRDTLIRPGRMKNGRSRDMFIRRTHRAGCDWPLSSLGLFGSDRWRRRMMIGSIRGPRFMDRRSLRERPDRYLGCIFPRGFDELDGDRLDATFDAGMDGRLGGFDRRRGSRQLIGGVAD